MLLVSLSGPSGAGKTRLIEKLGCEFPIIPEKYLELNEYSLDNTLVLSKWAYINYWFNQALSKFINGQKIIVSDRSPLDTIFYVTDGDKKLLPPILQSIEELCSYGIKIRHILIYCEFNDIKERISERLMSQPQRSKYHEDDVDFIKKVYENYRNSIEHWNASINTSCISESEALLKIKEYITLWASLGEQK